MQIDSCTASSFDDIVALGVKQFILKAILFIRVFSSLTQLNFFLLIKLNLMVFWWFAWKYRGSPKCYDIGIRRKRAGKVHNYLVLWLFIVARTKKHHCNSVLMQQNKSSCRMPWQRSFS